MRKKLFVLVIALWGLGQPLCGQTAPAAVELANMREDLRVLMQRMGQMNLRIEQLERDNARLVQATHGLDTTYATVSQLNSAVADLSRAIQSGDAATREQVAKQLKDLGTQTNAALDALSKNMAARPAVQTSFDTNFPKQGVTYTVQKGDTLSSIANDTGAKLRDIINANKITDPTKLQVGQTLFIPNSQ